jgi:hypothetical protein
MAAQWVRPVTSLSQWNYLAAPVVVPAVLLLTKPSEASFWRNIRPDNRLTACDLSNAAVLVTRGREVLILGDQCRATCGARVRRAHRSLSEQKFSTWISVLIFRVF